MRRIVLLIVLLTLSPLSAYLASPYGLKELLMQSHIQPNERLISHPLISIWRLEFPPGAWNGVLSDRWHSSDAFQRDFRSEFMDGFLYYLKARGFKIDSSPEAMEIRVTMDHVECRKGIDDDGGDFRGTFTLSHGSKILAKKELFKGLVYQDQEGECDAFANEFGLKEVGFPTVLFYRLSVSFFESIEAVILESQSATAQQEVRGEASP